MKVRRIEAENIPNVNNDGQQNIESAVQSDTVKDIENVKKDFLYRRLLIK